MYVHVPALKIGLSQPTYLGQMGHFFQITQVTGSNNKKLNNLHGFHFKNSNHGFREFVNIILSYIVASEHNSVLPVF